MTNRTPGDQVAFVRLNGQAIRVTSWTPSPTEPTARLVVIARGTRDVEALDALLATAPLTLGIEGEPDRQVAVGDVDRRAFGEGQRAITRHDIGFRLDQAAPPEPDALASPPSIDDRLAALEYEVASLKARLATLEKTADR